MPFPLLALGFWGTISTFVITLLMRVVPWLTRYLLAALGVGAVTYFGIDYALDVAIDFLYARFNAIPPELRSMVDLMGVADAIAIIVAGSATCVTIKGLTAFTKWKAGKPSSLLA